MLYIVKTVKDAQDQVACIDPITRITPGFDLAAAYRVAAEIRSDRIVAGAKFVGRKIGFTNPQLWKQFGVNAPIWGAMYDDSVISAKDGQVVCALAPFCQPKIEPEIVFQFHKTPPADASMEELISSIGWVAPGFEIVQSHFQGWRFTAADAVADGSLHGLLIIGAPVSVQKLGDDMVACLEKVTVALSCNDLLRQVGKGENVLGNPLFALKHLIAQLARDGMAPIEPGEVITTGSMTEALSVLPGEQWSADFDGAPFDALSVVFK